MKLLVLIGLMAGSLSVFGEDATTATTVVAEEAVVVFVEDLVATGYACDENLDENGAALGTYTCTMEDADTVVDAVLAPVVEETEETATE